MTEHKGVTWSYLAGFLDGDGWITESKTKNSKFKRITVGFTQKSELKTEMMVIKDYLTNNGINARAAYRDSITPSAPMPVNMINITISEQQEIKIQRKTLWVYGYLAYRDLLDTITEVGFVYHWIGAIEGRRGFAGYGPSNYVFEKKRN